MVPSTKPQLVGGWEDAETLGSFPHSAPDQLVDFIYSSSQQLFIEGLLYAKALGIQKGIS